MKEKFEKKIFRINLHGQLVDSDGEIFRQSCPLEGLLVHTCRSYNFSSLRAFRGDVVFEVHRDKHGNIVYREYVKNHF